VFIPKIIHQIGSKIPAMTLEPWTPKNQKNETKKQKIIANPKPPLLVAKPINQEVKN
jgi:hypothetical protein